MTSNERAAGTHHLGSIREGRVKTLKEGLERNIHQLESTEGRTSQDTEKVSE